MTNTMITHPVLTKLIELFPVAEVFPPKEGPMYTHSDKHGCIYIHFDTRFVRVRGRDAGNAQLSCESTEGSLTQCTMLILISSEGLPIVIASDEAKKIYGADAAVVLNALSYDAEAVLHQPRE
jgi:hypothetical protein